MTASVTATLGSVIWCSPDQQLGEFAEIAFLSDAEAFPDNYSTG